MPTISALCLLGQGRSTEAQRFVALTLTGAVSMMPQMVWAPSGGAGTGRRRAQETGRPGQR